MPSSKALTAKACLSMAMVLVLGQAVLCKEQWDINHGANNPPIDPRFMPGGIHSGFVPKVGPDFWKGQMAHRVPAGTVLTTILEDNLNSGKNKQGDTFTLTLQDGFIVDTKVLVPANSKIIGSIIAVKSAKKQRMGMPGQMDISLQSLVFPDGRHLPIFANVDSNPNHAISGPPKKRHAGAAIADYGDSLKAMAFSFVTGPGFMMNKLNRGLEFQVDKGEAIPIRLTRSLEVPDPPAGVIAQPSNGNGFGAPVNANSLGAQGNAAGCGSPVNANNFGAQGNGAGFGSPVNANNFGSSANSAGFGGGQAPYPPNSIAGSNQGTMAGTASGFVPGLVDPQGPLRIPATTGATNMGGAMNGQGQPGQPRTLNDLPDPF